jgi:hypothetical protein
MSIKTRLITGSALTVSSCTGLMLGKGIHQAPPESVQGVLDVR